MTTEKQTPITITSSSVITLTAHSSPTSVHCIYSQSTDASPKSTSEKSLRRPVTWTSDQRPKPDILGLQTPSVVDRVTEWMGRGITDNDKVTVRQKGGSMIVRCDFDKVVKEDEVTESNVREVTSLYSYLEKNMKAKPVGKVGALKDDRSPLERQFQTPTPTYQQYEMQYLNSGIKAANYNPKGDERGPGKQPSRTVSTSDSLSCQEEETALRTSHAEHAEHYEIPMSPESQKKELCRYLQLMNPADKKQTLLLQNRRSVRVKNLNMLMEKKQLEQELKKQNELNAKKHKSNIIDLTETDDSLDGVPTLKSFKDLNIRLPVVDLSKLERKPLKTTKEEDRIQWPSSPCSGLTNIDLDNKIHSQSTTDTESTKLGQTPTSKKGNIFRWPSPPIQALRKMDFEAFVSDLIPKDESEEDTRKDTSSFKVNGHISSNTTSEIKYTDSNCSEQKESESRDHTGIRDGLKTKPSSIKVSKKSPPKPNNKSKNSNSSKKMLYRKLLRRHSPQKLKSLRSRGKLRSRSLNNLIVDMKFKGTTNSKLRPKTVNKTQKNLKRKSSVETNNADLSRVKMSKRPRKSDEHSTKENTADNNNEISKIKKEPCPVEKRSENRLLSSNENVKSTQDTKYVTAKTSQSVPQSMQPSCEIVTVQGNPDDDFFDLGTFMDDINELDGLSEEHRRCLIESRILSSKSPHLFKTIHLENLDKKPATSNKSPCIVSDGSDLRKDQSDSLSNVQRAGSRSSSSSHAKTPTEVVESAEVRDAKTTHPFIVVNGHPKSSESDNSVEFLNWKVVYNKKSPHSKSSKLNHNASGVSARSPKRRLSHGKDDKAQHVSNSQSTTDSAPHIEDHPKEMSQSINEPDIKPRIRVLSRASLASAVSPSKASSGLQHFVEDSNSSSSSSSSCGYTSSSECSRSPSVKSDAPVGDHDYIESNSVSRCSSVHPPGYQQVDVNEIESREYPVIPLQRPMDIKSLHKSLTNIKRKSLTNGIDGNSSEFSWSSTENCTTTNTETRKMKQRSDLSHSIRISNEHGPILKAFYVDDNLMICQESQVAFWTQSALGHVLGAQNMWLPKGKVQRLVLTDNSMQKDSAEMVISMESTTAYVELWTKEHKSDIREGPVADVFATIYFWRQGHLGLDKKVLQLENINGFGDDVQYVVLKSSQKIIVSWHCVTENSKGTFIHCYDLAADYQTVANISEMEPVKHYVSSLHNIEDCESLLMGCGENKITLWNLDYGYVVATIELNDIKSPLLTLWVKCVRGFLFTLQQCVDGELRLIAINGMNHTWKRLQSYNPPEGFDRLRGVSIENGILVSFYEQGILCWNAQNGEPVVEEIPNETEYIPSGRFVIMNINGQIIVRHALTHLVITDDS